MNERCRVLWGGILMSFVAACAAKVQPSALDAGPPQDRPALVDDMVLQDQPTNEVFDGGVEDQPAGTDVVDSPRVDIQVFDTMDLDAGPLPPDVDPFGPEIPVTRRAVRRLLAGDRFTILRGGGRAPRAWGGGLLRWFPDASAESAMRVVDADPDLDRYDYQFGGTVSCRTEYQPRRPPANPECWGEDTYGQLLGRAPDGGAARPISMYPESASAGELIVGHAFVCGSSSCWGTMDPQHGAVSRSEYGIRGESWVTSANARHRCGVSDVVRCAGLNRYGETGRVQDVEGTRTWQEEGIGFRQVERLAIGLNVTYAIRFDGSLWCWGFCPSELSWTGGSARATPRPVFGFWNIAEVVVLTGERTASTCARTRDGHVRCWGRCSEIGGRCRNPSTNPQEDGVWDFAEPTGVVEIVAGARHFCALTQRNEVWCWGRNQAGEIRPGEPDVRTGHLPARVDIPN